MKEKERKEKEKEKGKKSSSAKHLVALTTQRMGPNKCPAWATRSCEVARPASPWRGN
jgi:hypothetical protein